MEKAKKVIETENNSKWTGIDLMERSPSVPTLIHAPLGLERVQNRQSFY